MSGYSKTMVFCQHAWSSPRLSCGFDVRSRNTRAFSRLLKKAEHPYRQRPNLLGGLSSSGVLTDAPSSKTAALTKTQITISQPLLFRRLMIPKKQCQSRSGAKRLLHNFANHQEALL